MTCQLRSYGRIVGLVLLSFVDLLEVLLLVGELDLIALQHVQLREQLIDLSLHGGKTLLAVLQQLVLLRQAV